MHHVSAGFDWNDQAVARLRALWAEGLPTAEIGRRLGISKNAVVGKSHRLDLPPRAPPIRTTRSDTPGRQRPPRRPRCPSLAELRQEALAAMPSDPPQPPPMPAPPVVPIIQPVRVSTLGTQRCCWPIGEPGTSSFRFCEASNDAGKPYCPGHCDQAYRKPVERVGSVQSRGGRYDDRL